MTINLKIALAIMAFIYILLIIKEIKNKKLQLSFSTFWLISGILLIIAIVTPNLIEYFTKLLGFEVPVNMLFCITIFVAFYLIFKLTLKLSNESQKNVTLVQEISLLKKRIENLENKLNKGEKNG
ncbi:MAG: DUF2304 domain-containing protein [Clostridia bacterium]|nr:DUF2304 domain-containing protein [Clostridia bacterium]